MGTVSRVPTQRQQAVLPSDPEQTRNYLLNQRRDLQRDWRITAEAVNEISNTGAAADLPPTGMAGRIYLATDTNYLYVDNGNGHWVRFGPGTVI